MKNFTSILAALFSLTASAAQVGSAYQVYRMGSSGTIPAFGAIDVSQSAAVTGVLKPANGGDTPRNLIINGGFDLWQRGISFSSTTGIRYTADRMQARSTGTTHSVDRGTFTPGQTSVPGEPQYNFQFNTTTSAGASNNGFIRTHIEDVRNCAGQTCTLSFWAVSPGGNKNIATEFFQNFGSGGSPSAEVTAIGVTTHAVTTSWQKFTVTVSFPSISGKTIGTNANTNFLGLNIWVDCGSSFSARCNSIGQQSAGLQFASMSLVYGSNSPDVFQRAGGSIGGELALAQRYYEKSYATETDPATSTTSGLEYSACRYASPTTIDHCNRIPFKVTKRDNPSCSLWNDTGTANQWKNQSNSSLATSVDTANPRGFNITSTADSGKTTEQGAGWYGHWACDADF